jgi:hypothetical protein
MVPFAFPDSFCGTERIEPVYGKRKFGQRHIHDLGQGVLVMGGINREEILASEIGLVCDARPEGVRQVILC